MQSGQNEAIIRKNLEHLRQSDLSELTSDTTMRTDDTGSTQIVNLQVARDTGRILEVRLDYYFFDEKSPNVNVAIGYQRAIRDADTGAAERLVVLDDAALTDEAKARMQATCAAY